MVNRESHPSGQIPERALPPDETNRRLALTACVETKHLTMDAMRRLEDAGHAIRSLRG